MKYQSLVDSDNVVVMTVVLDDDADPISIEGLTTIAYGDDIEFSAGEVVGG